MKLYTILMPLVWVVASCTTNYTVKLKDNREVIVNDPSSDYKIGNFVHVKSYPMSYGSIWIFYPYTGKDTLVYDKNGYPIEWRSGVIIKKGDRLL